MIFPTKLTTDELLLRVKEWVLLGYDIDRHSTDIYIGKKRSIGLNFRNRIDATACYRRKNRHEKEWTLAYRK